MLLKKVFTLSDRNFTQHQFAEIINVNRNFVYEIENKNIRTNLYKALKYLGYVQKLFVYRINYEYPFNVPSEIISLEKNTLTRLASGRPHKKEIFNKINDYLT